MIPTQEPVDVSQLIAELERLQAKRTPGEWRLRVKVDRGDDLTGTDAYYYIAAGCEEWFDNKGHFHPDDARYVLDEYDVVALGFDRDYFFPEGGIKKREDADLIAAAPRLLAQCVKALQQGQHRAEAAEARVRELEERLPHATAQLRHAYSQIANGSVGNLRKFADGLLAPQIVRLEALMRRASLPSPEGSAEGGGSGDHG